MYGLKIHMTSMILYVGTIMPMGISSYVQTLNSNTYYYMKGATKRRKLKLKKYFKVYNYKQLNLYQNDNHY